MDIFLPWVTPIVTFITGIFAIAAFYYGTKAGIGSLRDNFLLMKNEMAASKVEWKADLVDIKNDLKMLNKITTEQAVNATRVARLEEDLRSTSKRLEDDIRDVKAQLMIVSKRGG